MCQISATNLNLQKGVVVHNSANKGQVNGELVDLNALNSNTSSAAGQLAAAIPSLVAFPAPFNETIEVKATADSKLKVRMTKCHSILVSHSRQLAQGKKAKCHTVIVLHSSLLSADSKRKVSWQVAPCSAARPVGWYGYLQHHPNDRLNCIDVIR
jgi:hypothetical protein